MLQITFAFVCAVVFTRVQGQAQHAECGTLELSKDAEEGVLTSHKSFGRCPYPPGMKCQWVIKGIQDDPNYRIRFQFKAYEMPKYSAPCPATATGLKISDEDFSEKPLAELCDGRVIPANISSSTDKVVVTFSTSSTDFGAKGFLLHVRRKRCNSDQFMCKGDATCINLALRCNGNPDCPEDKSDEEDCAYNYGGPYCALNYIQCRVGKTCIPASKACDGNVDCPSPDESDEVNCGSLTSCPKNWHRCTDSRYAPTGAECDKTKK